MSETGSDAGFTLIELLVVLAVMALLMMAVPALVSAARPGVQSLASARAVANGLRSARNQAIRENRTLVFAPAPQPVAVALHGRDGRIVFFPDGSSSGGEVLVGVPEHQHRLRVRWLTGQVTLDD